MPFLTSYARLTSAMERLQVEVGNPPHGTNDWLSSAALAHDPAVVRDLVEWDIRQGRRDYGSTPRPDAALSLRLHRYAWSVCLLMSVPWFLDRRVPRLPVEHLWFHRENGWLTVDIQEFWCLPKDPARELPGALVVRDETTLRAMLRSAVAEHFGPILAAFQPHMRRGPHALWGAVTDDLTEGLWRLGRLLDQEERAVTELSELLPGHAAPFTATAGFRRSTAPEPPGRPERTRLSCCLFYTLRPAEICATCPRNRADQARTAR